MERQNEDTGALSGAPELAVRPLVTFRDRARGLIRRPGGPPPDGRDVCLAPCSSIHTFFMEGPIDAAFVTKAGEVVRVERGLPPNRLAVCAAADLVVERISREGPWLEEGDHLDVAVRVRRAGGGEESHHEALPGMQQHGV